LTLPLTGLELAQQEAVLIGKNGPLEQVRTPLAGAPQRFPPAEPADALVVAA
jgi:hypothetical protein